MAAQNIRIFHPTLARAKNGLMTNKLVLDCEDLQPGRVLRLGPAPDAITSPILKT